jgi:uncharacterized protein (DUF1810 family)
MEDPYDLERFVSAQDAHDAYEHATNELGRGRKTSHWMWFVFPQIAGLGQTPTSRLYAISSLAEARAYLEHPVLGPRLRRSAQLVAGHRDRTAEQIFGGIDSMKLRSSMTLFMRAAPDEAVFGQVISSCSAASPTRRPSSACGQGREGNEARPVSPRPSPRPGPRLARARAPDPRR